VEIRLNVTNKKITSSLGSFVFWGEELENEMPRD